MEWITWGEALHLGHDGIDRDHQKLAAIINRLADGVINQSCKRLRNSSENSSSRQGRTSRKKIK